MSLLMVRLNKDQSPQSTSMQLLYLHVSFSSSFKSNHFEKFSSSTLKKYEIEYPTGLISDNTQVPHLRPRSSHRLLHCPNQRRSSGRGSTAAPHAEKQCSQNLLRSREVHAERKTKHTRSPTAGRSPEQSIPPARRRPMFRSASAMAITLRRKSNHQGAHAAVTCQRKVADAAAAAITQGQCAHESGGLLRSFGILEPAV
jgi:hypothetical protein